MRRRRQRVTWLPTTGTNPSEADDLAGLSFAIGFTTGTDNITGVLPLTFDYPQEAPDLDPTVDGLSEIVGNEYIIQRIVGKMHAWIKATGNAAVDQQAVLLGAGLFVARADSVTGPNGANSPIGTPASIDENYGVLSQATIREPWMWRRTWILGNGARRALGEDQTAPFADASAFPSTTGGYGSVADGPHIDVKVKRRVSQDDRLWLGLTARPWPLQAPGVDASLSVEGYFDYRILGSLRKARNNSAF